MGLITQETIDGLQITLARLADLMASKGLIQTTADLKLTPHTGFEIWLWWDKPVASYLGEREIKIFKADSEMTGPGALDDALANAIAFVVALPDPEEAKRRTFQKLLASAIEAGVDAGLDYGATGGQSILENLREQLKRTTENIIAGPASPSLGGSDMGDGLPASPTDAAGAEPPAADIAPAG